MDRGVRNSQHVRAQCLDGLEELAALVTGHLAGGEVHTHVLLEHGSLPANQRISLLIVPSYKLR